MHNGIIAIDKPLSLTSSKVVSVIKKKFNLSKGTIKATVLIETILAAFEMDEILYELRDNIVGLNCGRWDYIFSFIKKFKNNINNFFSKKTKTLKAPFKLGGNLLQKKIWIELKEIKFGQTKSYGEIAKKLNLRFVPDLSFSFDNTFEYANKIEKILNEPKVLKDL